MNRPPNYVDVKVHGAYVWDSPGWRTLPNPFDQPDDETGMLHHSLTPRQAAELVRLPDIMREYSSEADSNNRFGYGPSAVPDGYRTYLWINKGFIVLNAPYVVGHPSYTDVYTVPGVGRFAGVQPPLPSLYGGQQSWVMPGDQCVYLADGSYWLLEYAPKE